MVVVLIILAVTAFIIRAAKVGSDKAKIARCKAELAEIQMALDLYRADWGNYPDSRMQSYTAGPTPEILAQALVAGAPGTRGKKYLNWPAGKIGSSGRAERPYHLKDPWGNSYQYIFRQLGVGGGFPRGFSTRVGQGESADLPLFWSKGPDGIDQNSDDIGVVSAANYNNPSADQSSYMR
jgi:type II secretory pathway pseudopilin PulG